MISSHFFKNKVDKILMKVNVAKVDNIIYQRKYEKKVLDKINNNFFKNFKQ